MKPPSTDGAADIRHEALVEPHIMHGNEDGSKHLVGEKKVADGATGEIAASVAVAVSFDWIGVLYKARIAQPQRAGGGEGVGIAAVARGEDAVEHIDSSGDGGDDVAGIADAHEVAGFIFREQWGGVLEDLQHGVEGFADGQAADGVAGEIELKQFMGAALAEIEMGAALDDSEEGLVGSSCVSFFAFGGPAERALDGLLVIFPL